MKKTINKNDLVIIHKKVDDLKENDIIAINKNDSTIITRIYQIDKDYNNIVIKGDNNLYPNDNVFNKENVEGKIIFKIPLIGIFISFLQSKIIGIIVVVLLILKFQINKELKRRFIKVFKQRNLNS